MRNETLRGLVCLKLHQELSSFRDDEMCRDKDAIYGDCFQIHMYIIIYEIMVEELERLPKSKLKALLDQPTSIIRGIYEQWLEKNGDGYNQIQEFIMKEVA